MAKSSKLLFLPLILWFVTFGAYKHYKDRFVCPECGSSMKATGKKNSSFWEEEWESSTTMETIVPMRERAECSGFFAMTTPGAPSTASAAKMKKITVIAYSPFPASISRLRSKSSRVYSQNS